MTSYDPGMRLVVLCSLLLILGCPTAPDLPQGPDPCREPTQVEVLEFIDGDTVDVRFLEGELEGTTERVRLQGIDTPEIDQADPLDSEFCAVRGWNEAIGLLQGETAWLTFDTSCTGTFDRTLAYMFRASDELWLNRHLVEQGYARVSSFTFSFRAEFEEAEAEAMAAGRGLWGLCDQ